LATACVLAEAVEAGLALGVCLACAARLLLRYRALLAYTLNHAGEPFTDTHRLHPYIVVPAVLQRGKGPIRVTVGVEHIEGVLQRAAHAPKLLPLIAVCRWLSGAT
jgi:hypothetical protein